jgi:hypothetical protein
MDRPVPLAHGRGGGERDVPGLLSSAVAMSAMVRSGPSSMSPTKSGPRPRSHTTVPSRRSTCASSWYTVAARASDHTARPTHTGAHALRFNAKHTNRRVTGPSVDASAELVWLTRSVWSGSAAVPGDGCGRRAAAAGPSVTCRCGGAGGGDGARRGRVVGLWHGVDTRQHAPVGGCV